MVLILTTSYEKLHSRIQFLGSQEFGEPLGYLTVTLCSCVCSPNSLIRTQITSCTLEHRLCQNIDSYWCYQNTDCINLLEHEFYQNMDSTNLDFMARTQILLEHGFYQNTDLVRTCILSEHRFCKKSLIYSGPSLKGYGTSFFICPK